MNNPNLPPYSLEAECGIIGAILCKGHEVMENIYPTITQESFWDNRNKLIFGILEDLWKGLKPTDTQTLLAKLSEGKMMDLAGGEAYIFKVSSAFPTDAHVRHYVQEISQKHRLRKLLELADGIMRNGSRPEDPEEYIQSVERQFYDLAESRQDENLLNSSHAQLSAMLDKFESGEGIGAIETGVSAIDNSIMGIVPGMMDVYAAEAGCGKTSLVEMIALRFLLQDIPILIFQRDMTPSGFLFRLACRMAGISVSTIRRYGDRMPKEVAKVRECSDRLSRSHLKLYSPDGCTGADVRAMARREARRSGIKLVIVDHIRTLRHSKNTSWDGLEENSGYIRQSTNETGVAHLVLAHINREGAKSDRPTISNIKGGDQLKDDSDNCCVMWAPEGKPERGIGGDQTWKVSFAFDKTRWDWNSVETMNYNGPKMKFETIK